MSPFFLNLFAPLSPPTAFQASTPALSLTIHSPTLDTRATLWSPLLRPSTPRTIDAPPIYHRLFQSFSASCRSPCRRPGDRGAIWRAYLGLPRRLSRRILLFTRSEYLLCFSEYFKSTLRLSCPPAALPVFEPFPNHPCDAPLYVAGDDVSRLRQDVRRGVEALLPLPRRRQRRAPVSTSI
ncbi:hypothetical protein R3P38DRAFT_3190161 [Favolaschia claudopus]|uniref:Uncharacterized protein n=1 Tax=Favolaschia claudopus TaxID=2862362 RepID=A0AAW0BPJ1_9AGAR